MKTAVQVLENYSEIFYLYRRETLQKLIKQIEIEALKNNQILPFFDDMQFSQ